MRGKRRGGIERAISRWKHKSIAEVRHGRFYF